MVDSDYFADKNVLITGGLGFIGSNLAIRLVGLGANVTLVDAMLDNGGGNKFNVESIKDKVRINYSNIRDKSSLRHIVINQNLIFHLAAQMSHTLGLKDPKPDLENNIEGTISLLECCKEANNGLKVIYTGSRGQYGKVKSLPVKEDHERSPLGSHEITKDAAEEYMFFYHRSFGTSIVASRLSNIYGPHAQMKSHEFGVANWFVRLGIDYELGLINKSITLMGDGVKGYGKIKRDFLYIDDCIDALLALAENEEAIGNVYNIGNDIRFGRGSDGSNICTDFEMVAKLVSRHTGIPIEQKEFSEERKQLEPGDFYPSISKLKHLGWSPATKLEQGILKTIEFYRKHHTEYWPENGKIPI